MEGGTTEMTALNRLLEPLGQTLSEDAARQILSHRIDPAIQARIEELADRCNEGLLTEAERIEYEGFVEGIGLINVLKATARRVLSKRGPS
jgi:hypothetical protein